MSDQRRASFLGFSSLILVAFLLAGTIARADVRIKDVVEFGGVRGNDLVGYGLVVGLNGSGDGIRNAPFTEEAMSNLLERLGVNITGEQIRPKNVAAVLVTAVLPPFARNGGRIDVVVSAIGDAKSLLGGTLIMTPLNAADGQIYAVAQGSVISSGLAVEGDGQTMTQGVPTTGTIPAGARVERELNFSLEQFDRLNLSLNDPDFTTAERIEQAINKFFGRSLANMIDSGTIEIELSNSPEKSVAHLISELENITIKPDQRARVVVDHRSGTIVLGDDVRISPVAVAQGNLTVQVAERNAIVAPNPFFPNSGPVVVPETEIQIDEQDNINGFAMLDENVSLTELVEGLNSLGVGPRDTIDILKAIKAAGALHAEFVVQ